MAPWPATCRSRPFPSNRKTRTVPSTLPLSPPCKCGAAASPISRRRYRDPHCACAPGAGLARGGPAPNLNDWDRVLVIYARQLERLAPKLNEKDLGALVASGAMFYRTLRQAEAARLQALDRWSGPGGRSPGED
ncbi:hypothetical protein F0U64_08635 [Achromobacter xylosoxidans]|nr:hypothetical protein F0U64_08635 [Achromobacter xylosoxidans]